MAAYQLKVTKNNINSRETYFMWCNESFGWVRIPKAKYFSMSSQSKRADTFMITSNKKYTWHTKVVYV